MLTAGHSELDRLRMQALVREEAGRRLLTQVPGATQRADGRVVDTDFAPMILTAARDSLPATRIANAETVEDDLFASRLASRSFDLVHARFPAGADGTRGAPSKDELAAIRVTTKERTETRMHQEKKALVQSPVAGVGVESRDWIYQIFGFRTVFELHMRLWTQGTAVTLPLLFRLSAVSSRSREAGRPLPPGRRQG